MNDTPLGKAPALLTNNRLGIKGRQGTNTLAYLSPESVAKKLLQHLELVSMLLNLFVLTLMFGINKLECLFL